MCSIFGIFGLQPGDDLQGLRRQALDLSQRCLLYTSRCV